MTNKVQNFWLNRAELRKKIVLEKAKKIIIPSIYNTQDDDDIEDLIQSIQVNYQI